MTAKCLIQVVSSRSNENLTIDFNNENKETIQNPNLSKLLLKIIFQFIKIS